MHIEKIGDPNPITTPQKIDSNTQVTNFKYSPQIDYCYYCVDFMGEAVDDLLNAILNGMLGGCADVCSYLGNQYLEVPCVLICEYVGFNEFVAAINVTDPDPIYICQLIDMCPIVNGGVVKFVSAVVDPAKAPQGTTFNLTFTYQVVQPTGPGLIALSVFPPENDPDDMPLGTAFFTDGQAQGYYRGSVGIDTTPSENEAFDSGIWIANVAVCEGDCTNAHPYGGVYADMNATFTITN